MPKKVLRLEALGAVLAIVLGSALHFVFEWGGRQKLLALIAAVNESTWEHLKLGFWPILVWTIIEFMIFGSKYKNFIFAKAVSLITFCLSVVGIFYSYTAILGRNYLVVDILTFVVSVIIGYVIGYEILSIEKDLKLKNTGILIIIFLIIMFVGFTYFPPINFLFKDPVTGGYGIVR